MASGGARTRSGPAPDPNALHRARDHAEWTTLPAAGRLGDPPAWPLFDQAPEEATLWEREWRRPQAIMWERNGQHLEVALFVRAVAGSVTPDASAADRGLVQRKLNDLGLTVPGLRANRWIIAEAADVAPMPASKPVAKPARARSARERLKVVREQGA